MLPPDFAERRKPENVQIIVIDNIVGRRQTLARTLKPYYRITECEDSDQAMNEMHKSLPMVALVSERLSPLGGYEFVKTLRHTPGFEQLPVIMVVKRDGKVEREGLEWCGANRVLVWPNHTSTALMMVSSMCNLHVQSRWEALSPQPREALKQTLSVFNAVSESIRQRGCVDITQVGEACTSLVSALRDNHIPVILDAVKEHDDYTYVHCLRVSTFLSMFGHITGMSVDNQILLATGGLLHDIGKINIPYEVLNKPDRLTLDEFGTIKEHVHFTVDILKNSPNIRKPIITIASQHHEKMDGSGYPDGMHASELNELGRIAAIVDVFGALTDRRPYKGAMDPESALNLMLETMSHQLDTRLLTIFRQAMLDAAIFSPHF